MVGGVRHAFRVGLWAAIALAAAAGCGRREAPPERTAQPPVAAAGAPAPAAQPEVRADRLPTQADLLFPHAVGDTWEMAVTAGLDRYRLRLQVVEARVEEGDTVFTVRTERDGRQVQIEQYRIGASGVVRTACGPDGTDLIEPPTPMLPMPFTVGASWSWSGATSVASGEAQATASFELTGPERVRSGVGDHQAYVITQRFTLGDTGSTETVTNQQWFAPGLGMVRQVTDDGEQRAVSELVGSRVGGESRGTLADTPAP
ncbi:MAG TPA: hypothetical protein VLH79_15750 [Chthonomonadales bacterium]|nr:hypothetical protein [Chthonomonadales bacterium]